MVRKVAVVALITAFSGLSAPVSAQEEKEAQTRMIPEGGDSETQRMDARKKRAKAKKEKKSDKDGKKKAKKRSRTRNANDEAQPDGAKKTRSRARSPK